MSRLFALAVATAFAAMGAAEEKKLAWPQFRGPAGAGVADDQKPPIEIGPEKNVKWKVPVPSGLSSPIVVGDKIVITAFENDKLYTIAYNRADGKEAWRTEAPVKQIEKYYKGEGSPAASTCATDGERIVSYFGSCGLFAYDLNGKQIWKYELPTAVIGGNFGSGVSPIISDGMVILVRDETKGSRIIAVDANTGSFRWEQKRLSPASYCTPVIWDTPAGKQVVAGGHARMCGYDLTSGEEKWTVHGMPSACCASPMVSDGSLLFAGWSPGGPDSEFQIPTYDAMLKDLDTDKDGILSRDEVAKSPFKDSFDNVDADGDNKLTRAEWDGLLKIMAEGKNVAFALKPGGKGDVTESHVLWKKTKGLPYVSSAIAYRGQFVMVKDGGMVSAFDPKSGNEIYFQERVAAPGSYYASPVAANGHIYFTSLLDGIVTVIKAGGDKPVVVAKNPKLGERTSATPAIADNVLYIRTEKHLYAFAEKK